MLLENKKIGILVTGGIAAYKVTELVRQLIKKQARVRVMMTDSATKFITPLTLQVLSKEEVIVDTFSENHPESVQHIEFAQWCDAAILAPATANILGKLANGIADDVVSTTLLALTCPVVIAPAMNDKMFHHPAVSRNLDRLEKDGYRVISPETGFLAEGYEAVGRMPAVEVLIHQLERELAKIIYPQVLENKCVIVTAGGTKERIDPVRFISNDSSGKMGEALALMALYLGANVTLITTKQPSIMTDGMDILSVSSAVDMYQAIDQVFEASNYLVMAAAVSDFRMKDISAHKIKKEESDVTWHLTKNPDIIKHFAEKKKEQVVIGFAAETDQVVDYARKKLKAKNLDWIIANDVSRKDAGFNVDQNQVTILGSQGQESLVPLMSKIKVAEQIWSAVLDLDLRG